MYEGVFSYDDLYVLGLGRERVLVLELLRSQYDCEGRPTFVRYPDSSLLSNVSSLNNPCFRSIH
jgi:hypothetical protein